jgi:hypothetical protein
MQKDIVQDHNRSITVRRATTAVSAEAGTRESAAHMWREFAKVLWRDFGNVLAWLWRACPAGEGAYRPDLHYMRGPGPAWYAEYGHLASELWPPCTVDAQKVLPPSSRSP